MSLTKRTLFSLFLISFMMGAHVNATDGDANVFEDVSLMDAKKIRPVYGIGRPVEDSSQDAHEPTCIEECCLLGYVCCFDTVRILCEGIHSYFEGCHCCYEDEKDENSPPETYVTFSGGQTRF